MPKTNSAYPKKKLDTFIWSGKNRSGQRLSGEMEAYSPAFVRNTLRKEGVTAKTIRKKPKELFSKKIKPKDVSVASRQIATMLGAGIPVAQSYKAIADGIENPKLKEIFQAIRADVESGTALSEALKKFPSQFDNLYVSLVAVGERSGNLDDLMDKVALYMEDLEEIKSKVKGALWYPAAVLVVGFIVTALLLVFVIPQFEDLFSGFGASLPSLTSSVIELSQYFRSNWMIILGLLVITISALSFGYRHSVRLQRSIDRISLKIPVFGQILVKSAISRYSRTLATMFGSGVPLVDALQSVAGATGNFVYHEACLTIREDVSTGESLSQAMKRTQLFPAMILQMTATGEDAGELEIMLNKAADFYEREVRESVDNMSKLIEPIMISVLGLIVGTLVVAMYLPIFKMGSVV